MDYLLSWSNEPAAYAEAKTSQSILHCRADFRACSRIAAHATLETACRTRSIRPPGQILATPPTAIHLNLFTTSTRT